MNTFGQKVRGLREEKGITREEFCDDESELSVRQLARIESGSSIPNLAKAYYIAKKLNVTLGSITDKESLEIPKRYNELKYLILRIPTYSDKERLKEREQQFEEIFEDYYDNLPEEEQLIIDGLQSKFEVYQSGNIHFGTDMIAEYFHQVKKKKSYTLNDLAIIDLYLLIAAISQFDEQHFQEEDFKIICDTLLIQGEELSVEDRFLLNNLLLNCANIALNLKLAANIQPMLELSHKTMVLIQDFQKMPIYNMYRWKYALLQYNQTEAEDYYNQAVMFSKMLNDEHLIQQLDDEWQKDNN